MDGARHIIAAHRGRYAVRHTRDGYVILDPAGRSLGAHYGSKAQAETRCDALQRQADQAAKRGPRPCISCAKPFESEGIHNRMCPLCRARSSDGWDPHGLARKSGRPG